MVYHLGHMFLESVKRQNPQDICQIDAATGKKETYASVLTRSICLARSFQKMGLQSGDVLALGGRNHLDLRIPYFAALLTGLPIAGVDPFFKYDEIKTFFKKAAPKIAFCQHDNYMDYLQAAQELGMDVKVFPFDGDDHVTMSQLIEEDNEPIDGYEPATFDVENIYAWLVSTSGTTGVPKLAAFKHSDLVKWFQFMKDVTGPNKKKELGLLVSPVQWISAYMNVLAFLSKGLCVLQISNPESVEHLIDIINDYRPSTVNCSPSIMTMVLKSEKKCDLTCFNRITIAGAKIYSYREMLLELRGRTNKCTRILECYGCTENIGPVLLSEPGDPPGCAGAPLPIFDVKLVDPDTGNEVTETNVTGEMWTRGPRFAEYYNNPEETANAFCDGWFKTGDLLYKDENGKYYFVDRLKMLIKYRNIQVIPTELEELISSLEGVAEVAVVGIPDPMDGERPVACVVRQPGSDVTSQEIKDLVTSKLSASKQLRGGVIFLDELPKTSTGKALRHALVKIALQTKK